jgi:hypothetical protein
MCITARKSPAESRSDRGELNSQAAGSIDAARKNRTCQNCLGRKRSRCYAHSARNAQRVPMDGKAGKFADEASRMPFLGRLAINLAGDSARSADSAKKC